MKGVGWLAGYRYRRRMKRGGSWKDGWEWFGVR